MTKSMVWNNGSLMVDGKYYGCIEKSKYGFSVYAKSSRDNETFVATKSTESEAKSLLERYARVAV